MSGPDFDEIVGDDLSADERARLRRVHELLLEVGAPPELPPELASAPVTPKAHVIPLPPRRRWRTAAVLVAASLLLVFAVGWLFGSRTGSDHVKRTVAMAGPAGAQASLAILSEDDAGNWPMKMKISGLPALPHGKTYALWLTKHGELDASCGTFTVGKGTTTVRLNAPYTLKEYTGWVIVRTGTAKPLLLRTATV
jgi:Anti-sigma-K factor rskA, C-terminal